MTAAHFDTDAAEAAAIEAATGDHVRATLRPYLPHLDAVHPDAAEQLDHDDRPGCDWIAHFRAPTRFGWLGVRWPAPLNAEIAKVVADLCKLEEAAYQAHHGITTPKEP